MWKKKTRKTVYKGIAPKGEGWKLIGRIQGEARLKKYSCNWRIFLKEQESEWISIKAVCSEARKGKANIHLAYNTETCLFAQGSETQGLEKLPRLKANLYQLLETEKILEAAK